MAKPCPAVSPAVAAISGSSIFRVEMAAVCRACRRSLDGQEGGEPPQSAHRGVRKFSDGLTACSNGAKSELLKSTRNVEEPRKIAAED